MALSIIS